MTVSRNFPQKSICCCLMSVVSGHIFSCVIASAVARSTKNIALTAAANIKFFANLLMRIQSLVNFICAVPAAVRIFFFCRRGCRKSFWVLAVSNAVSGGRVDVENILFSNILARAETGGSFSAERGAFLRRKLFPNLPLQPRLNRES